MRPLRPKIERKRQSRNPSDNPPILNSSCTILTSRLERLCLGFQKAFHEHQSRRNRLFQRFCPIFHRQAKEKFLLLPGNQHHLQIVLLQVLSRTRRWLSYLEHPDISYCKPGGRRDRIYCGKNENSEKVYKPKHYLLWSLKEVVDMFNNEHDFNITYNLQKLLKLEKHLLLFSQTPEDDCQCEKSENSEMLLTSIKGTLIKSNYHELASKLEVEIIKFISGNVCSVKDFDCCSNVCDKCPGKDLMTEIMDVLSRIDSITYNKWMNKGNYV